MIDNEPKSSKFFYLNVVTQGTIKTLLRNYLFSLQETINKYGEEAKELIRKEMKH